MVIDFHTLSRGITPKRTLVAAAMAAAVTVPSGVALATAGAAGDPAAVDRTAAGAMVDPVTLSELSATEQENLLWMRQEEKMAGDVYRALYEVWGLRVFDNIQQAEQVHERETAAIMAMYGVEDPVAALEPGEFVDPEIRALHDQLVARGSTSATEALLVGALIEELDIADLRSRSSDVADVDALYTRLEQGSQNHLRAFVRNLERIGVEYEPEVLDVDDYEDIIDDGDALDERRAGLGQQNRNGGFAEDGHGGSRGHGNRATGAAGNGLHDGTGPALVHES